MTKESVNFLREANVVVLNREPELKRFCPACPRQELALVRGDFSASLRFLTWQSLHTDETDILPGLKRLNLQAIGCR